MSRSDSQVKISLGDKAATVVTTKDSPANLGAIPKELVIEVATYLDQATKARFAQTCREFKKTMDVVMYDQDSKEDQHALWWASVNNHHQLLLRLLGRNPDLVNYQFQEVHTLRLTPSTSRTVRSICQRRRGADFSINLTPLTVAIRFCSYNVITILLDEGADVGAAVPSIALGVGRLWFPIHWAVRVCQTGRIFDRIVGRLIKNGADINQAPLRQGPVYKYGDDIPIFQYLSFTPCFRKGSHIAYPDAEYETQLESRFGKFESLLQLGADPNVPEPSTGKTPIFKTANALSEYDPISPFAGLLALSHDVDRVYEEVVIPHALKLFQTLIRHGGKLNVLCQGTTPLHLLCKRSLEHESLIKYLIQCGVAINGVDIRGQTAIYSYVMFPRRHKLLADFIKKGANVNHQDKMGRTPLHVVCSDYMACHSKLQDTIHTLLEHGADPKIQDVNGHTALELLEGRKHPTWRETRQILYKATLKASGADTEEPDVDMYNAEEEEAWNRPYGA
ncbi:hypothetical protein K445DRAFT_20739 [Daldinia sp. EC12]|nr:ankyrin [Daldinia eschscholtzii]OTB17391.1 hypothetical protein K445DRAFT_20739 [Daldinia sp. EC12]